jgi:hypothetical protein
MPDMLRNFYKKSWVANPGIPVKDGIADAGGPWKDRRPPICA